MPGLESVLQNCEILNKVGQSTGVMQPSSDREPFTTSACLIKDVG